MQHAGNRQQGAVPPRMAKEQDPIRPFVHSPNRPPKTKWRLGRVRLSSPVGPIDC